MHMGRTLKSTLFAIVLMASLGSAVYANSIQRAPEVFTEVNEATGEVEVYAVGSQNILDMTAMIVPSEGQKRQQPLVPQALATESTYSSAPLPAVSFAIEIAIDYVPQGAPEALARNTYRFYYLCEANGCGSPVGYSTYLLHTGKARAGVNDLGQPIIILSDAADVFDRDAIK